MDHPVQEARSVIADLPDSQEMPELQEHPEQRAVKDLEEEWDEVALVEIMVNRDRQETLEREEIGEALVQLVKLDAVESEELMVHLEKTVDPEDLEHPVGEENPEPSDWPDLREQLEMLVPMENPERTGLVGNLEMWA